MISRIEDAIAAIARGDMVVVVDDEDRENEGDIVIASDAITPEAVAFMMNHARGLICVAMEGERLDELDIPLMVPNNTESQKTAFTVSVDCIHGTTTGISAGDRAATVRALVDARSRPDDFARPGHVFPLRANADGVLGRPGHTEAAVDLSRLAGRVPSGVICEVASDDGRMARLPELELFAERHGLLLVTIRDLVAYRGREGGRDAAAFGRGRSEAAHAAPALAGLS
ncbi:3,4-dihydroxy-2-butanone-4-phosphate synthase [Azospirillum sp. ST 5-10]|uniref:3,4-dihydroxy-2-butanone-4-phosphate synthase n=1 Tax=unclassified Azospirillum TaxID=2630922 RepID=UPI003F49FE7C